MHSPVFPQVKEKRFVHSVGPLNPDVTNITGASQIRIQFNIKNFYSKLVNLGFYSIKYNSSLFMSKLIFLNNYKIISFYNLLIRGYLNWFRCSDNFNSVKNIVWILRMGCLKTLAKKHKKNLKWALTTFTVNVEDKALNGVVFKLPSVHELFQMNTKFLIKNNFPWLNGQDLLNQYFLKLYSNNHFFSKCFVNGCLNKDIEIYTLKKLNKRFFGISKILRKVYRKQILLCFFHYLKFENENYTFLRKKL